MSLLQHDSKRGKYDQVWRTVWLLGLTRANSRPNSHNICIVYIYTINIIYGFLSNKIQWYMHENAKGTRNGITSANRFGGAKSIDYIYIYISIQKERWRRMYRCSFILLTRSWMPFRLTAFFPLLFLLLLWLLLLFLNKGNSFDNSNYFDSIRYFTFRSNKWIVIYIYIKKRCSRN